MALRSARAFVLGALTVYLIVTVATMLLMLILLGISYVVR
jgi:hypothetical protein